MGDFLAIVSQAVDSAPVEVPTMHRLLQAPIITPEARKALHEQAQIMERVQEQRRQERLLFAQSPRRGLTNARGTHRVTRVPSGNGQGGLHDGWRPSDACLDYAPSEAPSAAGESDAALEEAFRRDAEREQEAVARAEDGATQRHIEVDVACGGRDGNFFSVSFRSVAPELHVLGALLRQAAVRSRIPIEHQIVVDPGRPKAVLTQETTLAAARVRSGMVIVIMHAGAVAAAVAGVLAVIGLARRAVARRVARAAEQAEREKRESARKSSRAWSRGISAAIASHKSSGSPSSLRAVASLASAASRRSTYSPQTAGGRTLSRRASGTPQSAMPELRLLPLCCSDGGNDSDGSEGRQSVGSASTRSPAAGSLRLAVSLYSERPSRKGSRTASASPSSPRLSPGERSLRGRMRQKVRAASLMVRVKSLKTPSSPRRSPPTSPRRSSPRSARRASPAGSSQHRGSASRSHRSTVSGDPWGTSASGSEESAASDDETLAETWGAGGELKLPTASRDRKKKMRKLGLQAVAAIRRAAEQHQERHGGGGRGGGPKVSRQAPVRAMTAAFAYTEDPEYLHYLARREQGKFHVVMVVVDQYDDEALPGVWRAEQDAAELTALFQQLGYSAETLSPKAPHPWLVPTRVNVLQALRTARDTAATQHLRESGIIVCWLGRGGVACLRGGGDDAGTKAQRYLLCSDSPAPEKEPRRAEVVVVEKQADTPDDCGRHALWIVDAWPCAPHHGYVCVTGQDMRGGELSALYGRRQTGGVLAYYLRKALSGKAHEVAWGGLSAATLNLWLAGRLRKAGLGALDTTASRSKAQTSAGKAGGTDLCLGQSVKQQSSQLAQERADALASRVWWVVHAEVRHEDMTLCHRHIYRALSRNLYHSKPGAALDPAKRPKARIMCVWDARGKALIAGSTAADAKGPKRVLLIRGTLWDVWKFDKLRRTGAMDRALRICSWRVQNTGSAEDAQQRGVLRFAALWRGWLVRHTLRNQQAILGEWRRTRDAIEADEAERQREIDTGLRGQEIPLCVMTERAERRQLRLMRSDYWEQLCSEIKRSLRENEALGRRRIRHAERWCSFFVEEAGHRAARVGRAEFLAHSRITRVMRVEEAEIWRRYHLAGLEYAAILKIRNEARGYVQVGAEPPAKPQRPVVTTPRREGASASPSELDSEEEEEEALLSRSWRTAGKREYLRGQADLADLDSSLQATAHRILHRKSWQVPRSPLIKDSDAAELGSPRLSVCASPRLAGDGQSPRVSFNAGSVRSVRSACKGPSMDHPFGVAVSPPRRASAFPSPSSADQSAPLRNAQASFSLGPSIAQGLPPRTKSLTAAAVSWGRADTDAPARSASTLRAAPVLRRPSASPQSASPRSASPQSQLSASLRSPSPHSSPQSPGHLSRRLSASNFSASPSAESSS